MAPAEPQLMNAFPLGRICVEPWERATRLSGAGKAWSTVAVQVLLLSERSFPLDLPPCLSDH